MTDIKITLDEQALVGAIVPKLISAIEQIISDEFHKLFPRLRREDMQGLNPDFKD